jgi:1-acyl-sn-glycerol-3-phosphate acyltransferase
MEVGGAQHASRDGSPEQPLSAPAPSGGWERVIRLIRGLGVALSIIYFWTGGCLLSCIVVPYLALSERDTLARRRRLQALVARIWRAFHRWLDWSTLYRVRYEGHEPPSGPAVFIANHPSLLDVTAIISRLPHACCVVKEGLVRNPLVGPLIRGLGHVGAGDGGFGSGYSVVAALEARLSEGFPVLVFPEGTRSPYAGMRRFRRGAFEVARKQGVPLVPLLLRCVPPALGKGVPVWHHPRTCPLLTVHIDPFQQLGEESPDLACRRVQGDFRARLGLTAGAHSEEVSS